MAQNMYIRQTIMECPVCKKRFIPAAYHIYVDVRSPAGQKQLVCSYTCMRLTERLVEEAKKKAKRKAGKGKNERKTY